MVVYLSSHLRALLPTAKWLSESGWEIVVFFAVPYPDHQVDMHTCKGLGMITITFAGIRSDKSSVPLWSEQNAPQLAVTGVWRCIKRLRKVRQFYRALLSQFSGSVMLLPEENIGYLTPLLVKEAAQHQIAAVVLPYTIDNPVETAEAYWNRKMFVISGKKRRFLAWLFPRWIYRHKPRGVKLLCVPQDTAIAFELLRWSPPRPWQNSLSFSQAVAVESISSARLCRKLGVPTERIHVTGSFSLDHLAELAAVASEKRRQLLLELGLDPEKPVFLCAIPPDQFNTERLGLEFADHEEVFFFWIDTLSASGWNVVVSLHPHLSHARIRHMFESGFRNTPAHTLQNVSPQICPNCGHSLHASIETNFNYTRVRLTQLPVADLIPLCDVYVACISATIRWAIACGIPVVNHDLYRYGYRDFEEVSGVLNVVSRAEFTAQIQRLVDDPFYLSEVRVAQAAVAADWGALDGRGKARLHELLCSISSQVDIAPA